MDEKLLRKLKKTISKSKKDQFEIGTVIRFTSGGRYTYAVIKTAIGWCTTARFENGFVNKTLTFEELTELLCKADITDIAIATDWTSLG